MSFLQYFIPSLRRWDFSIANLKHPLEHRVIARSLQCKTQQVVLSLKTALTSLVISAK